MVGFGMYYAYDTAFTLKCGVSSPFPDLVTILYIIVRVQLETSDEHTVHLPGDLHR